MLAWDAVCVHTLRWQELQQVATLEYSAYRCRPQVSDGLTIHSSGRTWPRQSHR
jgi:hypothetical protein